MDTFEHFVRTEPFASREACDLADLIFINEAEYRGLYRENEIPKAPTILKHGPRGADYMADGMTRAASQAAAVQVVDDTGAGEILAPVKLPRPPGPRAGRGPGAGLRGPGGQQLGDGVRGGRPAPDPRAHRHPGRSLIAGRRGLLAGGAVSQFPGDVEVPGVAAGGRGPAGEADQCQSALR